MNNPEDKFVAFDIGNVLCHIDLNIFYEFMVERFLVSTKEQAEEFIGGIQYPQDLGLYNIRQGFYRFNPHLPRHTLQALYEVWIGTVEPSEPMLELVEEVIACGYSVALLSNIGFDHAGVVRSKCKIFSKCIQHFSCEVGARKPSKLFYQSFILQNNFPKTTMFFDDRKENLEAAKGYLTGIKFDLDDWENDQAAANAVRGYLSLK